jgi:type 1 fimbria pilin
MKDILMKSLFNSGRRAVAVKRVLASLSMMLCAIVLPAVAHATCTQGVGGVYTAQVSLPAIVSIPRDAVVGTVIAQGTANVPFSTSSPTGVYCDADTTAVFTNLVGGAATGNVMPTSVPGIGYQIQAAGNYDATATVSLPASTFSGSNCGQNAAGSKCYGYIGSPLTVQIVKTATIVGSATVPGGQIFSLTIGGITSSMVSLANSTQILVQTCSVTTPSVAVPLGSVKASVFTGVGSPSAPTSFQIGLNCSGVTSNVGITFTDINNPANTTNVLSLTPASTAKGVGIQILSGGLPVDFGPDSSEAGNTNQVMIGTMSNTSQNIPFTGRYVQTGGITPGTADGVATFTMSYQ